MYNVCGTNAYLSIEKPIAHFYTVSECRLSSFSPHASVVSFCFFLPFFLALFITLSVSTSVTDDVTKRYYQRLWVWQPVPDAYCRRLLCCDQLYVNIHAAAASSVRTLVAPH